MLAFLPLLGRKELPEERRLWEGGKEARGKRDCLKDARKF
jgi:hypothetical protein